MGELLALLVQQVPGIIQSVKDHHATVNPTLPPLTDAEAMAILRQALDVSEAKDDVYLSSHK